jgi:hypothetical protein
MTSEEGWQAWQEYVIHERQAWDQYVERERELRTAYYQASGQPDPEAE